VAVKVGGSAAARPQAGLDAADVVFEEPVEGGASWFVAIFQCSDPPRVGPVRGAHLVDADLLSQFGPVFFAFAGGSPVASQRVQAAGGISGVDGRHAAFPYHRDPGRRAPHNLFTDARAMRQLKPIGGPRLPLQFRAADEPLPGPSPTLPGSRRPTGASLRFSYGSELIRYSYDPASQAYLRFQGPGPHLADTGRQIRVVNLVVLWVQVDDTGLRDEAGNPSPAITTVGEGDALVLQGGAERSARWTRPTPEAGFRLVDREGKPVGMFPGNTWVHLVPKDRPAYVG
jgi:hypothetical protein